MRIMPALALLAVAGCGGENGGSASTTSVPPTPPAAATVHVGGDRMNAFVPQSVTITPGETVLWVWDAAPHTVTSGVPGAVDGKFCSLPAGTPPSPSACDSLRYAQGVGARFSHMFATAGSYRYFCEVHGAMMSGTVIVGGASDGGSGDDGGSDGRY